MSNVWTRQITEFEKNEFVVVPDPRFVSPADIAWLAGNKAAEWRFKSNILVDGVLHHNYNEPHVHPGSNESIQDHIDRLFKNHLEYWTAIGASGSVDMTEKGIPAPAEKTQYQIDSETFQAAQSDYIKKYNANASAVAAKQTPPFSDKEVSDAFEAWKVAVSVAPGFWEFVPKDFPYPA